MSQQQSTQATVVIPPTIISRVDMSRLVREVEMLDNDLTSAAIRMQANGSTIAKPVLSEQLTDFLVANRWQIGNAQQRRQLITYLRQLKDAVPTIHLTFASPTDQHSLQQLVAWLRQSVHPQAVMVVGLQPSLIGGVYIRTINRVFDLSLRAQLADNRSVLVKDLEALSGVS